MADAKKCDICGKYYEHYENVTLEDGSTFMGCRLGFLADNGLIFRRFDLCRECMTKVHTLFYDISSSGGHSE